MSPFITNGALNGDEHGAVLIQRSELKKIIEQIELRDLYIALHNPRQTGKTTALYELQVELLKKHYGVAYVDFEGQDDLSKREFYRWVAGQILEALGAVIQYASQEKKRPPVPTDQTSFTEFLKWLSAHTPVAPKLVIIFDEVGGVPETLAKTFFSTLRAFQQAGRNKLKPDRELYQKIVFVFAGALDLRRLMASKNSPLYNVCKPFTLADFTKDQVLTLAKNLEGLSAEQIRTIAEQIYDWADGHPYLTQALCGMVNDCAECREIALDGFGEFVKQLVEEQVLYGDDVNLTHVLGYLENDLYRDPIFAVLNNASKKTVARVDDLVSIGVFKRGPKSFLRIRNKIYSTRLNHFFVDEEEAHA